VLATLAGSIDDPADRQRLAAFRPDLDRHLVRRATDTARPHLYRRLHVVQRLVEHAHRISLCAATALQYVERGIDGALGDRLLPRVHQGVHEPPDDHIAELGARQDLALDGAATSAHAILTSAAWRRTANGAGGAWRCPACRARHAGCDSARPAGPSRAR